MERNRCGNSIGDLQRLQNLSQYKRQEGKLRGIFRSRSDGICWIYGNCNDLVWNHFLF